jgi:ubiquinone/menaquinone biosynthesis C-methylase UbiE
MEKKPKELLIRKTFSNTSLHLIAAEIIRKHSTNTADIRSVALDSLDLAQCRSILDIGCGFGFFTEALKGRIHRNATVTGIDIIAGYRDHYLETCKRSGINGLFLSEGLKPIRNFRNSSFDLILCSYALYFFSSIIPDVARILDRNGHFVIITHSLKNMSELVTFLKNSSNEKEPPKEENIKIEEIITEFSSENGEDLLRPWFSKVQRIQYENTLIFKPEDAESLMSYFHFKCPFFISEKSTGSPDVLELFERHIQIFFEKKSEFKINKNDAIFICSDPVNK